MKNSIAAFIVVAQTSLVLASFAERDVSRSGNEVLGAISDQSRPSRAAKLPAWCGVDRLAPSDLDVPDIETRKAVAASGLPWRIVDRRTGMMFVLIPDAGPRRLTYSLWYHGLRGPTDSRPALIELDVRLSNAYYLSATELSGVEFARIVEVSGIPGPESAKGMAGSLLPLCEVSLKEIMPVLTKASLSVPREHQWAYAAILAAEGRTRAWHRENLLDRSSKDNEDDISQYNISPELLSSDGFATAAPPRACGESGMGIYDLFGNVYELCGDSDLELRAARLFWRNSGYAASSGFISAKGGSYLSTRDETDPGSRQPKYDHYSSPSYGFRLCMNL